MIRWRAVWVSGKHQNGKHRLCLPAREGIRVDDVGSETRKATSELGEAVAHQLQLLELLGGEVEGRHGFGLIDAKGEKYVGSP